MRIRALRPDDGPGLAEAFEQLSETSRYRRFFSVKPRLSEQSLAFYNLAERAAQEGIRQFTADILAENQPMLTLAHRLGQAETTHNGTTVSARIDLTEATEQAGTVGYDGHDLLRAAARGECIGLPAVMREWLDLSEKFIATLLVPVSAFFDTSRPPATTAAAPGRPEDPSPTGRKPVPSPRP